MISILILPTPFWRLAQQKRFQEGISFHFSRIDEDILHSKLRARDNLENRIPFCDIPVFRCHYMLTFNLIFRGVDHSREEFEDPNSDSAS